MVLLHTADIHVGAFSSHTQFQGVGINALRRVVDYALDVDAEVVIIAGDLLHLPRLGSVKLLNDVIAELRRLSEAGIPVVGVRGSHDTSPTLHDHLATLERAGLIHVTRYRFEWNVLVLEPLVLGDRVFYGIPGLKNGAETEFIRGRRVRFIPPEGVEGGKIIVLAHTHVSFPGYNPADYAKRYGAGERLVPGILEKVLPKGTAYVALGHIHYPLPPSRVFKGRVAYPGAPVGSTVDDLRETLDLRRRGYDRRVLVVDDSKDPPEITSMYDSFDVAVEELPVRWVDEAQLIRDVRRVAEGLDAKYKAILLTTEEISRDSIGDFIRAASAAATLTGALVTYRIARGEDIDVFAEIQALLSGTDREHLERKAIEEFVRREGLAPPGREGEVVEAFLHLMDTMGDIEGTKAERAQRIIEVIRKTLLPVMGGRE